MSGFTKRRYEIEVDSITGEVAVIEGTIYVLIEVTAFTGSAMNDPEHTIECSGLNATGTVRLVDGEMYETGLTLNIATRQWCKENKIAVSSMINTLHDWLAYEVGFQLDECVEDPSELDTGILEHSSGFISLVSTNYCVPV